MSRGGGVIIEGGGPTAQEMSEQCSNLFRRFVDEGDLLLGRALEMQAGRELYERIRNYVLGEARLSAVYDYFVYLDFSPVNVRFVVRSVPERVERDDDDKILVLKMIEKAVADFIQRKVQR